MMTVLQKIHWAAAMLCGLLLVSLSSSPALAAEKSTPEKAYWSDVCRNMMDVDALHYEAALAADTPMGQLSTDLSGDAQLHPLVYKNDVRIWVRDEKGKENSLSLKQYAEENQGNAIVYTQTNAKWIKQTLPLGEALGKKLSAAEKETARQQMMQLVKTVSLQKETPAYKYMEITLDPVAISDMIAASLPKDKLQDKTMQSAVAMGRMALLAAGDLTYTAKIDKQTKQIREIDMDLTGPVRKGAAIFLAIGQPKEQKQIEEFLSQSTLKLHVAYSDYNKISPVVIPADVKDNATEYTPDVKTYQMLPKQQSAPGAPAAEDSGETTTTTGE